MVGFSSIMTGVNFIATIHMLRAPGMTWFRLPLFVWAIYATSLVMVLATPVLAMTLLLVMAERWFGTADLRSGAAAAIRCCSSTCSGSTAIPPSTSWSCRRWAWCREIIACFARRRIFGYDVHGLRHGRDRRRSASSSGATTCSSRASRPMPSVVFSFLSSSSPCPRRSRCSTGRPHCTAASISFDAPMLYALGFVGLFTIGGLTGCSWRASRSTCMSPTLISSSRISITSWSAARCRPSSAACISGGRRSPAGMYPESWAAFAAMLMFFGFNLTFFPQFVLGYLGMPRRYHVYPPEFQIYHVMSSSGAAVLGVAYLLPLVYFTWSLSARPSRRRTIRGTRPGSNGRRLRRRRTTISSSAAGDRARTTTTRSEGPRRRSVSDSSFLRPPWESLARQHQAVSFGMWIFLISEVLLFSGLFAGYAVVSSPLPGRLRAAWPRHRYRSWHRQHRRS